MINRGIVTIVGILVIIGVFISLSGCTGTQVVQPTPEIVYVTVAPTPTPQVIYVTPVPTPTAEVIYVTPIPTQAPYTPPASNNAVVDQTVAIPKGYYQYESVVMNAYTTVSVDVSTDGNGITFMIMDSGNFNKYSQSMASGDQGVWNNYIDDNSIVQKTYTFKAPSTDRYYFIMDNTGRTLGSVSPSGSVNVHITMTEV